MRNLEHRISRQRARIGSTKTFVIVGERFSGDEIARIRACIRDINFDRRKRRKFPLFYRYR